MLDLQLPARHDWAVQETNYGKLVMEPFEPGFALRVGIASAGYGQENPVANNDTEQGRAKNRRLELVVVKR